MRDREQYYRRVPGVSRGMVDEVLDSLEKGESQRSIARRTGISRSTIGVMLHGHSRQDECKCGKLKSPQSQKCLRCYRQSIPSEKEHTAVERAIRCAEIRRGWTSREWRERIANYNQAMETERSAQQILEQMGMDRQERQAS